MSDSTTTSTPSQQPIKRCPLCCNEFPLTPEYWGRDKHKKSGFQSRCKTCQRDLARSYRKEYPERSREANRRSYLANNGKEYARRWRENNPDKVRDINHRFYINNADMKRKYHRDWSKANPEKGREATAKRRGLKANAEGSFTTEEVELLYIHQQGRCFHCGCDLEETGFHCDHWIPLTHPKTSNSIENIRLLCPKDNLEKHNKLPWEWSDRYEKPEDFDL